MVSLKAFKQPGYIYSGTLLNLERPVDCWVISRWTTLGYRQVSFKLSRPVPRPRIVCRLGSVVLL